MLLLFFVLLGYTNAQYNVTVTVLEPFCLYMYDVGPSHDTSSSQLFLETYISSGNTTSSSYHYVSKSSKYIDPSITSFRKSNNTYSGPLSKLELDTGISVGNLSVLDDLNVVFSVNPIVTPESGTPFSRCDLWDRMYSITLDPQMTMNISESKVNVTKTLLLNETECLSANKTIYPFFHCTSHITVRFDLDCYGPCDQLIATTTTTTTTSSSSSTSVSATKASDTKNDLFPPMVTCAVLAGLEFVLLIGIGIHFLRNSKHSSLKRRAGASQANDDGEVPQEPTSSHIGIKPVGDHASVDVAAEPEYAAVQKVKNPTKPAKNSTVQPGPSQNNNNRSVAFADNKTYG